MKKVLGIGLVLLAVAFISNCKKETVPDSISIQNIHGQVYSYCTDSGLANVPVYFGSYNSSVNGRPTLLQTVSGADGSFSFNNVQIHSGSNYIYDVEVNAVARGNSTPITGNDVILDKSNITQTWVIRVFPYFNSRKLYFPNTLFTANDTFVLTLQQNTIHRTCTGGDGWHIIKNCPCSITTPTHLIDTLTLSGLNDYVMGLWKITLDKTKNGVHTINTNNFYIGWGATVTDTIPW